MPIKLLSRSLNGGACVFSDDRGQLRTDILETVLSWMRLPAPPATMNVPILDSAANYALSASPSSSVNVMIVRFELDYYKVNISDVVVGHPKGYTHYDPVSAACYKLFRAAYTGDGSDRIEIIGPEIMSDGTPGKLAMVISGPSLGRIPSGQFPLGWALPEPALPKPKPVVQQKKTRRIRLAEE